MNIASLGLDFQLGCSGNAFDGIQGLNLTVGQSREMCWSDMASTTHESCSSEVGDESSILMKEDWSALKFWPVEYGCVSCYQANSFFFFFSFFDFRMSSSASQYRDGEGGKRDIARAVKLPTRQASLLTARMANQTVQGCESNRDGLQQGHYKPCTLRR